MFIQSPRLCEGITYDPACHGVRYPARWDYHKQTNINVYYVGYTQTKYNKQERGHWPELTIDRGLGVNKKTSPGTYTLKILEHETIIWQTAIN